MTAENPLHAGDRAILPGTAEGEIVVFSEGVSFWGGVDPETGRIIDVHHPAHGTSVSGKIVLMPTSRGSCSGSGVLLELSLAGRAPAALVFCAPEEILTLGALVSERLFGRAIPTLQLSPGTYGALARAPQARITPGRLCAGALDVALAPSRSTDLHLSAQDRARLEGQEGAPARIAMEIICLMAAANGVDTLVDVTRGHIDGCILAHSANLIFAEKMAEMGAQVVVPTTINAISVDREHWHLHEVPQDFGARASRLADAYVKMGARPVFTCAPYLLEDRPREGELIGWSESNAVIFANTVLGARSPKHPDYLDLFIAMTGRAPASGVYAVAGRAPGVIVDVTPPATAPDDLFWPLLGWIAGRASPDRIPLLRGLEGLAPTHDDLKALCAAFGTTSGAPMLHIAGITPEADLPPLPGAPCTAVGPEAFEAAWAELNQGLPAIDLVAIGSPHASHDELRAIVAALGGRACAPGVAAIITLGRDVLRTAEADGTAAQLRAAGFRLLADLCWCSINEPVFPPAARGLITNSGKYAHYAHGLCGRHARLGSLATCVEAAVTGRAPEQPPAWMAG